MKYRCTYCDEEFESKGKLKKARRYCPYCHAVKHGEPDPSWLPSVKGDELDKRGFHKV